jgi:hypothetical protein
MVLNQLRREGLQVRPTLGFLIMHMQMAGRKRHISAFLVSPARVPPPGGFRAESTGITSSVLGHE